MQKNDPSYSVVKLRIPMLQYGGEGAYRRTRPQKFRTCIRRIISNAVTLVTYRNCELLQKYET